MLKRYPYTGWLILALICWAFTGYRFYQHTRMARPASMAQTISQDLQDREEALNEMLQRPGLVNRMFSGTLTAEEVNELADAPFLVFAFEQDSTEGNILIFWNSNAVVGVCDQNALAEEDYSLYRHNGVYLKRCLRLPNMAGFQSLVVLYPILSSYPIQNEYLRSSFAAAGYIPSSTLVSEIPMTPGQAVAGKDGKPLFYLQFQRDDLPRWIPDPYMAAGLVAALLFSLTWIHLIALSLARRGRRYGGLALIAGAVGMSLGLIYLRGLPFHLEVLPIFSSQLYAASSAFPSLGILLLHMFGLLWIVIYLLTFFNQDQPQVAAGRVRRGWLLLYFLILRLSSATCL